MIFHVDKSLDTQDLIRLPWDLELDLVRLGLIRYLCEI